MQENLEMQMQSRPVLFQVTADELKSFVADVVEQTAQRFSERAARSMLQVSQAQAAKCLGVSPVTLWRWDKEGYFRAHKVGKKTYYLQSELDELKAARV